LPSFHPLLQTPTSHMDLAQLNVVLQTSPRVGVGLAVANRAGLDHQSLRLQLLPLKSEHIRQIEHVAGRSLGVKLIRMATNRVDDRSVNLYGFVKVLLVLIPQAKAVASVTRHRVVRSMPLSQRVN